MPKVMPYPGTQAVRRAVTLLKMFNEEHPQWKVTDLARHAKFKKSTASRLLIALEREGLLVFDPARDAYSLGPELIVLGGRAMRSNDLQSLSRSELQGLAEATGETASLEVLSVRDVLIIGEVLSGHLLSSGQTLGTRWPAFATSTGLAILAYRPEDEVEEALKAPLPKLTPKTITSTSELRRLILEARATGYAVAEEALELGYVAIGAPLRNESGYAVGAVSVGGPVIRITPDRVARIGELLRRAAERISSRLGHAAKSQTRKYGDTEK